MMIMIMRMRVFFAIAIAALSLMLVLGSGAPAAAEDGDVSFKRRLPDPYGQYDIFYLEQLGAPIHIKSTTDKLGVGDTIPEMTFPLNAGLNMLSTIEDELSSLPWRDEPGKGPWARYEFFAEEYANSPQNQGIGVGLVPFRSPAPAFSRNLLISRDLGTPLQTEPHMAVNPNDSDHLVMIAIDYALPSNAGYVSFDGGETWQHSGNIPLTQGGFFAADPVVVIDRDGLVHHAYMSVGSESFRVGPFYITFPKSDIAISVSGDGGLNWEAPAVADTSSIGYDLKPDDEGRLRGFIQNTFLDKPWMAVGPNPDNPDEDIVYVSYTVFLQTFVIRYAGEVAFLQFVQTNSIIMETHSKDDGETWSTPQSVSPFAQGLIVEDSNEAVSKLRSHAVQGSQPVVSSDGSAYIVWYDSTTDGFAREKAEFYISTSENGGETWSEPRLIVEFNEGPRHSQSSSFRNSYFPSVAIGPDGELHVVYAAVPQDKSTDNGDIYYIGSLDRGVTWSEPARLNQDSTSKLQFFPAVATDKSGGIHVMWGDSRDHVTGLKYHIYYTRSLDGGKTWGFDLPDRGIHEPSTRVTDFASNPQKGFPRGRFIGDYFDIQAGDNADEVFMVWADTRLGEFGPFNQKIGFARREAIPSPEVFLNPARGPGGQEVTIQAFNFQPELEVFARVGGQFIPLGKTNERGEVSKRVFLPVASQGAHDVSIFDESGNVALGSFFMDFGFGDLQKLLEEVRAFQEKTVEMNASTTTGQQDLRTMQFLTWSILILIFSVLLVVGGVVFFKRRQTS